VVVGGDAGRVRDVAAGAGRGGRGGARRRPRGAAVRACDVRPGDPAAGDHGPGVCPRRPGTGGRRLVGGLLVGRPGGRRDGPAPFDRGRVVGGCDGGR